MVVIDPYLNHTQALIGDKWFPRRGWAPTWPWASPSPTPGSPKARYDKEYIATKTTGFSDLGRLRAGQRPTNRPKTPGVGSGGEQHPRSRDPGAGARMGRQEDHAGGRRAGRHGRRQSGGVG